MLIRVISDPQPQAQEPEFVKEAYIGLCLSPSKAIPPGNRERFPQGFYLVPIGNFLKQMKAHNPEAYSWHSGQWGELTEALEETNYRIQLVFPADCCFECDNEAIQ